MNAADENPLSKIGKSRKAKRAVRFLGVASLLLGVLTLIKGEFSMGRYRSIATGTTAVVIGVMLTTIGVVFVVVLFGTRKGSSFDDDQPFDN